ncbi:MAG: ABC transporter substrate-binding protein [Microbacterium sp.]
MKRSRLTAVAAAIASLSVVVVLSGCGGASPEPAESGSANTDPYQWGINAELSGNVSFYGKSLEAGIQAYVDEVNADGGIDGHPIELTALDNAGDAARSTTNATQLATADGVTAMFGFVLSANCSAATPIVERNKVPLACLSVAEPNDYVFSLGPNSTLMGGALLEATKTVTGEDEPKVALLHVNTLTVTALAEAIQEQAADAGVDLVESQEVDLAATDSSAQIAKIVASQPDAVIISNFGPGFLAGLKGLRAAGLDVPVVWADGTGNLSSLAESTDENVYAMTAYQLVQADASSGAEGAYLEAVGPTLDPVDALTLNTGYTAMAYMTARAFGDATRECGYPCTGEQLQEILSTFSTDMESMVADFSYDNDRHYPYSNWYLYHVVGTEYDEVEMFPHD